MHEGCSGEAEQTDQGRSSMTQDKWRTEMTYRRSEVTAAPTGALRQWLLGPSENRPMNKRGPPSVTRMLLLFIQRKFLQLGIGVGDGGGGGASHTATLPQTRFLNVN